MTGQASAMLGPAEAQQRGPFSTTTHHHRSGGRGTSSDRNQASRTPIEPLLPEYLPLCGGGAGNARPLPNSRYLLDHGVVAYPTRTILATDGTPELSTA